MFSHPTKAERRAGQGAVSGRAPQGRWVRKERLNYASKRSGSRAFSRSSRCRPLPLSSFVPPGKGIDGFAVLASFHPLRRTEPTLHTARYLPDLSKYIFRGPRTIQFIGTLLREIELNRLTVGFFFLDVFAYVNVWRERSIWKPTRPLSRWRSFHLQRLRELFEPKDNCIVYCFLVLSPLTVGSSFSACLKRF